jgi:hypothetical protein
MVAPRVFENRELAQPPARRTPAAPCSPASSFHGDSLCMFLNLALDLIDCWRPVGMSKRHTESFRLGPSGQFRARASDEIRTPLSMLVAKQYPSVQNVVRSGREARATASFPNALGVSPALARSFVRSDGTYRNSRCRSSFCARFSMCSQLGCEAIQSYTDARLSSRFSIASSRRIGGDRTRPMPLNCGSATVGKGRKSLFPCLLVKELAHRDCDFTVNVTVAANP